jgi:TonB family protein
MIWLILLLGLYAVPAKGTNTAGPSEFYIVSEGIFQQKGEGAVSYEELLTVTPDGEGSVIHYVRIDEVFLSACGRGLIVRAIEARLSETSPAELAREANTCILDPRVLSAAQKYRGQGISAFEPQEMGMVARCGPKQIKLRLIDPRIVKSAPRNLWELANRVTIRAFLGRIPWNDASEAADLAMQIAGAQIIPEISSGRYDPGLRQACDPRSRDCKSRTFRELLEDYQGPRSIAQLEAATTPRLLDADRFRFAKYVDPVYPVLAKSASIYGHVELKLAVDPPTGNVSSVTASSGHQMLIPSAIAAARQWRFAPGWAGSEPVKAVLYFAIRCPNDPPLIPTAVQ